MQNKKEIQHLNRKISESNCAKGCAKDIYLLSKYSGKYYRKYNRYKEIIKRNPAK